MELYVKTEKGYKPAKALAVFEAASHYAAMALSTNMVKIKSSKDVLPMVEHRLRGLKEEHFGMLVLNAKHQVLDWCELSRGSISESPVYSRIIIKELLERNGAAVIFAHNHPSGDSEPSNVDITLTQNLINNLKAIDVRVLDHIVVGNSSFSFAENNLI